MRLRCTIGDAIRGFAYVFDWCFRKLLNLADRVHPDGVWIDWGTGEYVKSGRKAEEWSERWSDAAPAQPQAPG